MDRALFVLAQSGKPEARQVLVDIAKSNPNPDVQKHAIRNLGLFGGPESQQTLVDIYSTSQSIEDAQGGAPGADALGRQVEGLRGRHQGDARRSSAARPSSSSA